MKYEMIFGDEKLFDGAPKDAEAVTCVDGFNKLYYKFVGHRVYISMPSDLVWQLRMGEITHCMMTAMRRIIKEPKRWTVEDQKAGIFPDIGCVIQYSSNKELGIVEAVNKEDYQLCIKTDDGLFISYLQDLKPIETQEEKAARLRSEWSKDAARKYKKDGENVWEWIYDALLSGALSVPTKGGE